MRRVATVTLLVPDYDEAIAFYVGVLGFELLDDVDEGRKRFVRVAPRGSGAALLLARATTRHQRLLVGDQCGGRVGFFLETDDLRRDYARMRAAGIRFEEAPREERYGKVAVWRDPFGNRWDLLEPKT